MKSLLKLGKFAYIQDEFSAAWGSKLQAGRTMENLIAVTQCTVLAARFAPANWKGRDVRVQRYWGRNSAPASAVIDASCLVMMMSGQRPRRGSRACEIDIQGG